MLPQETPHLHTFKVLVYADENTLVKMRRKLDNADLLVEADLQLPKDFTIPKLFG